MGIRTFTVHVVIWEFFMKGSPKNLRHMYIYIYCNVGIMRR